MDQDQKKKLLIGIGAAAALVLLGGVVWLVMSMINHPTYHDQQYKFSVTYPAQWKKFENFQGASVAFIRPKKTALDTFEVNVNVSVQEVPGHIATLSSFSETISKQMIAVFGPNVLTLTDKDVRFAKRQGHQMVFQGAKPVDMKLMFIWTIKGSFAYIFTFAAQDNQYKEEWPVVQKMIDSFELK